MKKEDMFNLLISSAKSPQTPSSSVFLRITEAPDKRDTIDRDKDVQVTAVAYDFGIFSHSIRANNKEMNSVQVVSPILIGWVLDSSAAHKISVLMNDTLSKGLKSVYIKILTAKSVSDSSPIASQSISAAAYSAEFSCFIANPGDLVNNKSDNWTAVIATCSAMVHKRDTEMIKTAQDMAALHELY